MTERDALRKAAETVLESYERHCERNGLEEPGCLETLREVLFRPEQENDHD